MLHCKLNLRSSCPLCLGSVWCAFFSLGEPGEELGEFKTGFGRYGVLVFVGSVAEGAENAGAEFFLRKFKDAIVIRLGKPFDGAGVDTK